MVGKRSEQISPSLPGPVRILCALDFERASLRRAGLDHVGSIEVCGPGADGVNRWADRQAGDDVAVYILAGVAGGLHREWTAGRGAWVHRVVDADGERRQPTWPARAESVSDGAAAILLSTVQPVISRGERERWHAECGAVMVDLEAAAFARIATERGWRWGIVKAVSDDFEHPLPREAAGWVTGRGQTRIGAVLRSVARRPSMLPMLITLSRHSRQAMTTVAQLLENEFMQGNGGDERIRVARDGIKTKTKMLTPH